MLALERNSINKRRSRQIVHGRLLSSARDSSFLLAIVLFILITQVFQYLPVARKDPRYPLKNGERTWAAWAIDDFLNKREDPAKIVFLGSSLMLTPLGVSDAQFLEQKLDATAHHESLYFNELIKQRTGTSVRNFNFALPGEMPSDAYLITKLLLCGNRKPQIIVYGVGARDFMDNMLAGPKSTDPYRCLIPFDNEKKAAGFGDNPTWSEKLAYVSGQIFDPTNKREELARQAQLIASSFVSDPTGIKPSIHTLLPRYHPMEIDPGESLFKPDNNQDKARLTDNLEEYRRRYGVLNWSTFLTQFQFLARLLEQARLENVKIVLVEMPVTSVNRQLIPPPVWQSYQETLRVLSHCKGTTFIDLQATNLFSDADFGDTVHLNTIGGIKMLNVLAESFSKSDDLNMTDATAADVNPKLAVTKYSGL